MLLLPIIAMVFVVYLVIGIALPVLPLYVHDTLGLSPFVVGLVSGSQFAAALLSRVFAGQFADHHGSKRAVVTGLFMASASGLLYFLSLQFASAPLGAVGVLLLGRGLLGAAESFIITGALSWGLALVGAANTGKVMSWVGTALYAAFAVGAPAGTFAFTSFGFKAIALATTVIPIVTLALVIPLRAMSPVKHPHAALMTVVQAVWLPGVGLALSGVGFGAITTFITLLFAEHRWAPVWVAFTALSVAFMVGRLVLGHLPDRVGGAKVALVCVLVEAVGQGLIWSATSSGMALLGAILTGLGYSLVFPALGVEAIHSAPSQSRGLAMGTYTAFLDLSLGITGPALGLVASGAGVSSVFLVSTLVVLSSAFVAIRLLASTTKPEESGVT